MALDFGADAKTIQTTAPAMTRMVKMPASTLQLLRLMGTPSPNKLCGKNKNAPAEPNTPVLRVPTMRYGVTLMPCPRHF